eukprot:TRINITY_DN46634_c0_g1_i1.p1 TRINITY_DN46634_c0_g1~~TRINITY_DN46634_c0_g1_i1.p1  ORF type:complete len:1595 (+),score=273.13 TRINITY_DN46634_c0_g1_i1:423-4787(+)
MREKMEAFSAQHRSLVSEAKADVQILEHQVKEQLNYNMELSSRETRRDLSELSTRVESAQRFMEEGVDIKRHLADVDGSIESLSRRVESLASDMLQRHAIQGGLKGRLDMIETTVHEHRKSLVAAMDEVRDDIDTKSGEAELQRAMQRIDQHAAEFKAIRATNTKIETTVTDMKKLFDVVGDLNDRITTTLGDSEKAAVAMSAELGEVKGKLENLAAHQGSVDRKVVETGRVVQGQVEELTNNLTTRAESLVSSRCMTLEGKVAQKLDSILAEGKNWRTQNSALLALLEEKIEEHDVQVGKLNSELEGGIRTRLSQNFTELRELGRRVDVATAERKDGAQDMRREISTVAEIVQGLQRQYDNLLTESAARSEQWTDHNMNLRTRVEHLESQSQQWKTLLDNAMDDVRHQANTVLGEKSVELFMQVDQLMADRERSKMVNQRLEEDARSTAKALAELDGKIHSEIAELRETGAQTNRELAQNRTRLEGVEQRTEKENMRTVKAVCDFDSLFNQTTRELKDSNGERDAEIATLRRSLEFVTQSKLPALEQKVSDASKAANNNLAADVLDVKDRLEKLASQGLNDVEGVHGEVKVIKDRIPMLEAQLGNLVKSTSAGVMSEIASLRAQVDVAANQSTVEQLQYEVKALGGQTKEARLATDKLEGANKALSNSLEDIKIRLGDIHSEALQEVQMRVDNCYEELKGVRQTSQSTASQLTHLQRSCKELHEGQDKVSIAQSELSATNVSTSSQLNSVATKVESLKKLENVVQGLSKSVKDLTESDTTNRTDIQELRNANVETANNLHGALTRLDPAVKRQDQQLVAFTKTCKELTATDEKLSNRLSDLETQLQDVNTNLSGTSSRVDGLLAKPLATDSALKNLATHVESLNRAMLGELETGNTQCRDAIDRLATDFATRSKAIAQAILEQKNRVDSTEATYKSQITTVVETLEELRVSTDEKADRTTESVRVVQKDLSGLKSATHKLEVAFNDTKALGRALAEINDKLSASCNEMRAATSGINNDLTTTKARMEKLHHANQATDSKLHETMDRVAAGLAEVKSEMSDAVSIGMKTQKLEMDALSKKTSDLETRIGNTERNVRDNLQTDLLSLHEQVENKFQIWDGKIMDMVEGLQGGQEKLSVAVKTGAAELNKFQAHTDDVVDGLDASFHDVAGRLDLLLDKSGKVEQLNQFGVKAVKGLVEKLDEVEARVKEDVDNRAAEIDLAVKDALERYDEKLGLMQDRSAAMSGLQEVSASAVHSLADRLQETENKCLEQAANLAAMFELLPTDIAAVVEAGTTQQRVHVLHRTPAFAEMAKRLERVEGDVRVIQRDGGGASGGGYDPPMSSSYTSSRRNTYGDDGSSRSSNTGKIGIGMRISDNLNVDHVTDGGPAAIAGIRVGDVITAVDGVRVDSRNDYKREIRNHRKHDRVSHTVRRNGDSIECDMTLGSGSSRQSGSRW